MCGIVGCLGRGGAGSADADRTRRMLGALRHRGPDQFGVYTFEDTACSLGLGSARLSIIDLAGGQQPIGNEDGNLWIVFNGEVFDFPELRAELQRQGHRFVTRSDTEVVLHLFEQHGPDCLHHLNGQFALAIWDERRQELFLARDRLGIRPLYWTRRGDELIFASEIKGLLAHPSVDVRLDPLALDQIFSMWSPVAPRTAFQGISSLPPGHWLLARPEAPPRVERWWEPDFPEAGRELDVDLEEAARELRELLVDATRLRLRADVPVGAYLSGGLDSSAIAALVRRHAASRLETFSIAFDDAAFDESGFQRRMADHLGCDHHPLTCSHAALGRAFPEVIWHAETPIVRTSPAPMFLLSERVRDSGLKVVLTGEGADEFLAGYDLFKEAKVRRFWARQPGSRRRPALLNRLYPYIGDLAGGGQAGLEAFFGRGLERASSPCFSHEIRWRNTGRARRLFSGPLRTAIAEGRSEPDAEPWDELALPADFPRWSPLARAQYLEATVFLPEYLLSSQGDRMAMAHSVEGRFPFLDHRVVELCNRLPPGLKLRGLNEKLVLKRAVRDLLPEEILGRRKQPYRAPIHACFFIDGQPLEWVAELLEPRIIEEAGCFEPRAVGLLLEKLRRRGALGEGDEMALAGILSTQLVHHQFVEQRRERSTLNEGDDVKTVAHCTLEKSL